MTSRTEFHYDDFTEGHYRVLLAMALRQYTFVPFNGFNQEGDLCLWRHDVDFSLHRAKRLAAIESEMGVSATYFLNVHSEFYSALGAASAGLVRDIISMGHRIGLHFDPGFYDHRKWSAEERLAILRNEKTVLEGMFGVEVDCYSIHNPTEDVDWSSDDTLTAGMVNAYCREISARFTYVSDSNGIWRRGRLDDVLASHPPRLHVLTHPGWWTPQVLSPRERISRCIDGRARWLHESYDRFLMEASRPNVGRGPARNQRRKPERP